MRDFTLATYRALVAALSERYRVVPFREFLKLPEGEPAACLRHDVDRRPENAVRCAEVSSRLGVYGTFYFRVPDTARPEVLRRVASLGHEVGYHYETLSKHRGRMDRAVTAFSEELAELRRWAPVETACMHGAPLSRWDNREIWSATDLAAHGLRGEPYLSVDYTRVGYLTDTGRRWNDPTASIRDRVAGAAGVAVPSFPGTPALLRAIGVGELPPRLMVTLHPERWDDRILPWIAQVMGQPIRNVAKRALRRGRRAGAAPR